MSTTLTINVTGMAGGTAPGSSIRIDLQNCSNPRVVGTGQLVPLSMTLFPVNGIATITLFDNSQINCGVVNVLNDCGCSGDAFKTSYYSFNFIYQGVVTSIGSYRLKPGTFNLWDLNPCIGKDCICNDGTASVPVTSEVPLGNVDGVNETFLLTKPPSILWLMQNGVYQTQGIDFTLVENVITYLYPPTGALFAIYTFGSCTPSITSEVPIGVVDGVNTVFTTTTAPNPKGIWLYVDGIYQTPNVDFSLSGNTITFASAPLAGSKLFVDYVTGSGDSPYTDISTEVPAGVIDGTNTIFTISHAPRFLMIQYNSAVLIPGSGYTQAGTTLTLAQAPQVGDSLYATLFD